MRQAFKHMAVFSAFGLTIVVYLFWIIAFVNGGKVTISMLEFNEMWVEYFLFLIGWTPVLVLGLIVYIQDERE